MDKKKAYDKITRYLKSHYIKYFCDIYENTEQINMAYNGYSNCPDNTIESCIFFHLNCMEYRAYYTNLGAEICRNSSCRAELFRLFNFINAMVWPCVTDVYACNLYHPSYLYTPRIYMTEDGCYDITATIVIPYDFYEVAQLETEDYLTACIPELMDNLSVVIFGLLLEQFSIEEAINFVKTEVLNEK